MMEYHETYAQENRDAWLDSAQDGFCGACGEPLLWGPLNEDLCQTANCPCGHNAHIYSRCLGDGTVTIEE